MHHLCMEEDLGAGDAVVPFWQSYRLQAVEGQS